MTTRGDYNSLPGKVEALAAEAERALLEEGGSNHPDAHTYAAQAGAAMRSFFEPWFDVPDPAGFTALADTLRSALERLNVGLETETVNPTGEQDGGPDRVAGNEALQAVTSNASVFARFNGEAVLAFRDYFINSFDDRVNAQYCTVVDVRSALLVMAEVWEEARSNVAGIAEEALAATRTLPGGSGGASANLDVLGIVASVASLYPPLGIATKLIGIEISILGQISSAPADVGLQVTDLFHVSQFLQESFDTLSQQLLTAEQAVADHLRAYSTAMTGNPERFSLQPATRLYDEDRPDRLVPRYDREDAREMKAQPAAMVRYSHDMDDAAGVLDRAGSVVQDALSDSTYDLWSRQGVGMAPTAGMYDYRACLASVSELIEQTAVNTRDAAAHLRKVAALFVDTDEGVRRAMDELRRHERRIERRIEAEEAPATPQWPGGRPPHISRPGVTPW